jgi:hypothetical protein
VNEPSKSPFRPFSGTFRDRLAPDYFAEKSSVFSRLVSRTHDHFWDPADPAYIDFTTPFDMAVKSVMPFETVPELRTRVAEQLTPSQRIAFANDSAYWWLSGFLHGEQGALYMAVSLCESLRDPGVIEYAANQAREEARHVTAFTNYIESRWGAPLPVNPVFQKLLTDIVTADKIHRKIVGMQVLVEGLAMGFMAQLYKSSNDPVLVRLAQLVMTDETFHHKAGKLWAEHSLPDLSPEDSDDAEDWALQCFQGLMFNVFNPSQKQNLYRKYGLDMETVREQLRGIYTEEARRQEMSDTYSVFRILVRTLMGSGIVTGRTRAEYSKWVDLDALGGDAADPVEDAITADGLAFLKSVNDRKKHRHKPTGQTSAPVGARHG